MAAISKENFYQLEGLLTLARAHTASLKSIEKAAAEITKDPEEYSYYGHTSDAVMEGSTATELLKTLDIEVVDA